MNKLLHYINYNRIRILQIILVIIIVIAGFAIFWLVTPYKPTEKALALLSSTEKYTYSNTGNLEFIPTEPKTNGVIFYPGGRVEAASYAYICSTIAEEGYPCIIATMPLNLAVFKINAAQEIIKKYPEIENWVIGGHSLGGSMAARYTKENPNKISGVFFLASYTDVDISKSNLKSAIITGTQDNILDSQSFKNNYKNLPEQRTVNIIEGGNHSQFGDYGLQEGDLEAQIELEEQHKIITDEILKLLN